MQKTVREKPVHRIFIFGYHRGLCTEKDRKLMKVVLKQINSSQLRVGFNPLERENLLQDAPTQLYRIKDEKVNNQLDFCNKICLLPNSLNSSNMMEEVFSLWAKGYRITYFKSEYTARQLFVKVLKLAAKEFNIKEVQILQRTRVPEIIQAKICILLILKIFTGDTTKELGKLFNHSTGVVLHHTYAFFDRIGYEQKKTEKAIKNIGRNLFADLLIE